MEIVGAISGLLSCACEPACRPICQQLNYIRKVKENEQIMRRELDSLRSQERDISATLNTGKLQYGKRPKEEVTNWLKNLEEIENDVKSLGSNDAHHMCFKGFCPNYFARLKRSKKIVEILGRVRSLKQTRNSFGENVFIDSPPETSSLLAATLHGTSAERKKEVILQCIIDPEVSKIGVYGMGGVGKTTIMRHVYNQLKEKKDDFGIVMWVTVSSLYDMVKLQGTIAEQLGLSLSSNETSRAMELHEALSRRRNFVIILDDIWDGVSLQNVGIPESNNGSKIVWTTRFKAVCHSMDSDREIEVAGLTPEEAWSLFKEKVGGEDIISPEIKPIAEQVARECGGLPLALITVGRALRKENQLPVWRNALQELKTSRADQIKGMAEYVFGSLKFSYNWLSSDRIRACFLYCALYPEDHEISVDELIEYWMAEGLIDEEGSLQTEKDKGHAYLKELKDACMIESVRDGDTHVRMHDLIRDLAINITREQFMVKAGLGLKESPKEEEWVESLERVSLFNNEIEAFKGQPNCPQLSTLLLHGWVFSTTSVEVTFSDTFFKHMHNLRVLNLSRTPIKSLPDSLSDLVNLHALILTGCWKLEYLPSLAKLHKLRQLKLGRLSCLKELPDGLQNLVKLRHLDISRNISRGWRSFPSGALLKMSCLEILSMERSRWRISYGSDVEANSTVEEIIRLKNLMRFSADFADVLTFNSFINKADESELLKHLDFFQFTVGQVYNAHNVENESMKKVRLPAAAKSLGIYGCSNLIQLSDIFGWADLKHLISCVIRRCDKLEWIVKDGEIVLPSLRRLILLHLDSFKGLCKGKAHEQTLRNLRQLYIEQCHELKYLIPIDLLVNNLENLEEILIMECNEIEDIISSDNASATTIISILPKLKKLVLWNLPKLTSICQWKLVCDSLCDIKIVACPKLKKLPILINNVPPVSMKIKGKQEWWETLEWEDPQLKEVLQPFFFESGWMDPMAMAFIRERLEYEKEEHEITIGNQDLDEWGDLIKN